MNINIIHVKNFFFFFFAKYTITNYNTYLLWNNFTHVCETITILFYEDRSHYYIILLQFTC